MTAQVYRHTPDMGEISGFGGGYETACQNMLEAGVRWLVAREKPAALTSTVNPQTYGVLTPSSADAQELSRVVVAAAPDCSGAMHQAVMSRLHFIAANGWDAYCAELRTRTTRAS